MKIKNLSVSQYNTHVDCPRKWFFSSVLKIREPTTEAQQRGTNIHKAIEVAITGEVPSETNHLGFDQFVGGVREFFPAAGEEYYIEHRLTMPTVIGVPWIGYIDLWRWDTDPQIIIDWKSTSDLRYAKNPQDLRKDIQLGVYGHYAFHMADQVGAELNSLKAGLVYLEARAKKDKAGVIRLPKKPRVKPVFIDMERNHALSVWESTFVRVEKMARDSEASCADDVEPNTQSCNKYGGCPYRTQCGLSPFAGIGGPFHTPSKKKEKNMAGFLDRLKNKNGAASTEVKAAPPQTKDEPQITPPDAPPRNVAATEEELKAQSGGEAESEAPKKRGRPKGTKKKVAAATSAREGSIIYVDCLPVKGGDDVTTLEDWFGPINMELNEWAQTEKNLPDYRLTGFSEEKAALAMAVQNKIEKSGLPPTLLVSSNGLSRDLLPLLIPHATNVVRSLRG